MGKEVSFGLSRQGKGGEGREEGGGRGRGQGGSATYCAVRVGEGDFGDRGALVRGVQRFGHENGACDGEVVLVGDQGGTAEIGAGANTLDDARQGDEGFAIAVSGRSAVGLVTYTSVYGKV